jgi:hypothetical protein
MRGLNSSPLHDGDEDSKIRTNIEEGGKIWPMEDLGENDGPF